MAAQKKLIPYSQLSKSGKYYRDNAGARAKKKATDTKINARPLQKAKRRELSNANYAADKRGTNRTGKDLGHQKDGSLKYEAVKANRGKRGEGGRKKRT